MMKHEVCLKTIAIAAIFAVMAGAGYCREAGIAHDGMHLAEGRRPSAVIVIADDATVSAQFAAGELRHHVELITGAALPVMTESEYAGGPKVLVGESGFTREMGLNNEDFEGQEYLIKFLPGAIVLMGRDADERRPLNYELEVPGRYHQGNVGQELATCYAVYDFLERFCGVRWYLPTRVGKVFPEKETLYVEGEDIRRAPEMKYRALIRPADVPATLTDIPGELIPMRERQLYMLRQRLADVKPYPDSSHSFYGYYRLHLRDNSEWFAKGYDESAPSMDELKPEDIHPFRRDERHLLAHRHWPNMCYTNEEFIGNVIRRAGEYFDTGNIDLGERAAGDYFSVGLMDSMGEGSYCRCGDCRALIHDEAPVEDIREYYMHRNWDDRVSDYWFGFVNRLAGKLAETHPGKYLRTSVYQQHYYPPAREALEPNISIQHCTYPLLRAVPRVDNALVEVMDMWDGAAPENPAHLRLYFHRPGRAGPLFPAFMAREMVKQMQDYHRRGYIGFLIEPAYMSYEGRTQRAPVVNMLEMYIVFKLADNPELDGNELIDEYFELYYGAAGPAMQRLYEAIERVYCGPENYGFNPRYNGYQTPDIAWRILGTPERMQMFGRLMEEAKAGARTGMEKKRVGLFEKSVWERMVEAHNDYWSPAENQLSNSSFETPGRDPYEARLREAGFDVPAGPGGWAAGWSVNPSNSVPGKAAIVEGEGAPGSGKRYLKVEGLKEQGSMRIFNREHISAARPYRWSLWAKGEPEPGAEQTPRLGLRIIETLVDKETGQRRVTTTFQGISPRVFELESGWRKYEGLLEAVGDDALEFRFVLEFFQGTKVSVDEIKIFPDVELKSVSIPRVTGRTGDVNSLDWAQAGVLRDFGNLMGRTTPRSRNLEGRLLHDDEYLYVQLQEAVDTSRLVVLGDEFDWTEDVWELFFGRRRDYPYRQIGINARGEYKALAWGEDNTEWDSGAIVESDTDAPGSWLVRAAFPLEKLLPDGVKPGQAIYLNVGRGPCGPDGKREEPLSWNATLTRRFHEPSRKGEAILSGRTPSH